MLGFGDVPGAMSRHLAPEFPGARCSVPVDMKVGQVGHWGIPEKGFQKAVQKRLLQVASALHPKGVTKT